MTFQARKTRQRRKPDAPGVGKPLIPSAALRMWYKREMDMVVTAMMEDYRKEMTAALTHPEVQIFYAQDAAASNVFEFFMRKLKKKWTDIFKGFAAQTAPAFVNKADTHAKSSTWFSLTTAGIEQPRQAYTESVTNTLTAAVNFNSTLITRIQEEVHEKLYNAIMLSVTSSNPEEQGSSGIANALKEAGISAKKRVDLIARDQTSKLNSSLTTERMSQAGVTHFKWLHSSVGTGPKDQPGHFRQTHLDKDQEVFEINDKRLWTGPKADQGPPGWAINCRCRAVPLVGYSDDDD